MSISPSVSQVESNKQSADKLLKVLAGGQQVKQSILHLGHDSYQNPSHLPRLSLPFISITHCRNCLQHQSFHFFSVLSIRISSSLSQVESNKQLAHKLQKVLAVNRSSNQSCTWGMIHTKIYLISPDCLRPRIPLQCRKLV